MPLTSPRCFDCPLNEIAPVPGSATCSRSACTTGGAVALPLGPELV